MKEAKYISIPVNLFNLLRSVVGEKSADPMHREVTNEVYNYLQAQSTKEEKRSYPIQKFHPFFWLSTFALPMASEKLPKLTVEFKSELENKSVGLYHSQNHLIEVRPLESQGGLDVPTTARVFMHESTHALTHQIYADLTPPEKDWGGPIGLPFRISLLSALLSPEEGNFMQLYTAGNKDQYKLENYPQELIAETIAYTIQNGELPLRDSLLPKDRQMLGQAVESFLQDCKNYLNKLIDESGLSKVFPWLLENDWVSDKLQVPLNDVTFFMNYMRTGCLWQAAFLSQDIALVEKVVTIQRTSYVNFPFPLEIFNALEGSDFKAQIALLIAPSAPSAPPAMNEDVLSETVSVNSQARFSFSSHAQERPPATAPSFMPRSML